MLVLCSYAHPRTFEAYPGLDTIARLAGTTRSAVCRSLARMKALGVIATKPGGGCRTGGSGRTTTYLILSNSRAPVTVSTLELSQQLSQQQCPGRARTVSGARQEQRRGKEEQTNNSFPAPNGETIERMLTKELYRLLHGLGVDGRRLDPHDLKQARADKTCLERIVRAAVTSDDPNEASRQAGEVQEQAERVAQRGGDRAKMMRAFMAVAREMGWR